VKGCGVSADSFVKGDPASFEVSPAAVHNFLALVLGVFVERGDRQAEADSSKPIAPIDPAREGHLFLSD
jgi:hypothetical protein